MQGSIRWYSATKHYGFIKVDGDKTKDLFFHLDHITSRIEPFGGERVEFLLDKHNGKTHARHVRVIE